MSEGDDVGSERGKDCTSTFSTVAELAALSQDTLIDQRISEGVSLHSPVGSVLRGLAARM